MKRPLLIAEVKTKSPFGYESAKTWEEQFKFANTHGDILSIHTDVRWGGSFELLSKARTLTDKPILAKGIHADDTQIERAVACGAEYVLVVGRIPKVHLDKCLIEVNSLAELEKIPAGVKAVWNNRDLNTGGVKKETCKQARKLWNGWLCQASNISKKIHIEKGIDAILVGTHLFDFVQDDGG